MAEDPMPAWAGALQRTLAGQIDTTMTRVETAILERVEAGDAAILARVEAGDAAILGRVEAGDAAILARVETGDAAILTRVETGEAAILERVEAGEAAVLARVETGEAAILARVDRDIRRPLIEHIDARTAAIMERIDRLQARVDNHADSLHVNLGAAQRAQVKATEVEAALQHREQARAQDMRLLNDIVAAMQRQIGRLEAQVREIRERG